MNKKFEILLKCPLFDEMTYDDITALLSCLNYKVKEYKKGEFIMRAGEANNLMGIVLNGEVQIIKEDYWGNTSILSLLEEGGIFAEVFAFSKVDLLPVSVVANITSTILLLESKTIISPCSKHCFAHSKIIENMVKLLANKNNGLLNKIEHISKKTIREKIIDYLSYEANKQKKNDFLIPFNRDQLANYLSTDRSALSKELSKLRDEGVLEYKKNHFILK